jgi:hypothetical protein
VSRASRNYRHRVQRLQLWMFAIQISGSQGLVPRALRPERPHRLNAPGGQRLALCTLSRRGPKGKAVVDDGQAPGCGQVRLFKAKIAASLMVCEAFQRHDKPWNTQTMANLRLSPIRKDGKAAGGCLASRRPTYPTSFPYVQA